MKISQKRNRFFREIVSLGVMNGIPIPAFGASLVYYDKMVPNRMSVAFCGIYDTLEAA